MRGQNSADSGWRNWESEDLFAERLSRIFYRLIEPLYWSFWQLYKNKNTHRDALPRNFQSEASMHVTCLWCTLARSSVVSTLSPCGTKETSGSRENIASHCESKQTQTHSSVIIAQFDCQLSNLSVHPGVCGLQEFPGHRMFRPTMRIIWNRF